MTPPARKRNTGASRSSRAADASSDDPDGAGTASDASEAVGEVDGLPFEGALSRLEEIVGELEGGELELERSLAVFEEGVGLAKRCAKELDRAERRIEVLTRDGADWLERPFAAEADGEGN